MTIKIYKVGGCVRDTLLGIEPKDIDYVVVGATPEYMLANGYSQVGAAFPVFLKDGEEYALARKERKTGPGYHGFEVEFDSSVTLEEDLIRRDLTINAMAMDDDGTIVDPYGGQEDLQAGVLRHVSDEFAEDPVRVLRTARFAARYNFKVHPDTIELMRKVAPELDHVSPERIWAEFEKGLMESHPGDMGEVLWRCGAYSSVKALLPFRSMNEIMLGHILPTTSLKVRFACISLDFKDEDFEKCRIPTDCARVAKAFAKHRHAFFMWLFSTEAERVNTFIAMRAFSDDTLLRDAMETHMIVSKDHCPDFTGNVLADLELAKSIDAEAIAKACANPKQIAEAISVARVEKLKSGPNSQQWDINQLRKLMTDK